MYKEKSYLKIESKGAKSIYRKLIESIIMLLAGSCLLVFMHTLPDRSYWLGEINIAWDQLINAVAIISRSLVIILIVILIIIGILLGLILVIAGTIRFFKAVTFIKNKQRIKNRRVFNYRKKT